MRFNKVPVCFLLLILQLCSSASEKAGRTREALEAITQGRLNATDAATVPTVVQTSSTPSASPTSFPTRKPSRKPTLFPSQRPTSTPTRFPTIFPTVGTRRCCSFDNGKACSGSLWCDETRSQCEDVCEGTWVLDIGISLSGSPTVAKTASPTEWTFFWTPQPIVVEPRNPPSPSPLPRTSPEPYLPIPTPSSTCQDWCPNYILPWRSQGRFGSQKCDYSNCAGCPECLAPTATPTATRTASPTSQPTSAPSDMPSKSSTPSVAPSDDPSRAPSADPSKSPTALPTARPTKSTHPSAWPTSPPSSVPSATPSDRPSSWPSGSPSSIPTNADLATSATVVLRLGPVSSEMNIPYLALFESTVEEFLFQDFEVRDCKILEFRARVSHQKLLLGSEEKNDRSLGELTLYPLLVNMTVTLQYRVLPKRVSTQVAYFSRLLRRYFDDRWSGLVNDLQESGVDYFKYVSDVRSFSESVVNDDTFKEDANPVSPTTLAGIILAIGAVTCMFIFGAFLKSKHVSHSSIDLPFDRGQYTDSIWENMGRSMRLSRAVAPEPSNGEQLPSSHEFFLKRDQGPDIFEPDAAEDVRHIDEHYDVASPNCHELSVEESTLADQRTFDVPMKHRFTRVRNTVLQPIAEADGGSSSNLSNITPESTQSGIEGNQYTFDKEESPLFEGRETPSESLGHEQYSLLHGEQQHQQPLGLALSGNAGARGATDTFISHIEIDGELDGEHSSMSGSDTSFHSRMKDNKSLSDSTFLLGESMDEWVTHPNTSIQSSGAKGAGKNIHTLQSPRKPHRGSSGAYSLGNYSELYKGLDDASAGESMMRGESDMDGVESSGQDSASYNIDQEDHLPYYDEKGDSSCVSHEVSTQSRGGHDLGSFSELQNETVRSQNVGTRITTVQANTPTQSAFFEDDGLDFGNRVKTPFDNSIVDEGTADGVSRDNSCEASSESLGTFSQVYRESEGARSKNESHPLSLGTTTPVGSFDFDADLHSTGSAMTEGRSETREKKYGRSSEKDVIFNTSICDASLGEFAQLCNESNNVRTVTRSDFSGSEYDPSISSANEATLLNADTGVIHPSARLDKNNFNESDPCPGFQERKCGDEDDGESLGVFSEVCRGASRVRGNVVQQQIKGGSQKRIPSTHRDGAQLLFERQEEGQRGSAKQYDVDVSFPVNSIRGPRTGAVSGGPKQFDEVVHLDSFSDESYDVDAEESSPNRSLFTPASQLPDNGAQPMGKRSFATYDKHDKSLPSLSESVAEKDATGGCDVSDEMGTLDDFSQSYESFVDRSDGGASVRRQCVAPRGSLGVEIESIDRGPVVRRLKDDSPLKGILFPGDRIVAVDDVDTTRLTSSDVSDIMTRSVDDNRKITVLSDVNFMSDREGGDSTTTSDESSLLYI